MGHGGLRVANTFFNHTDEETASWISPGALCWRTLDLILLREPAGIRPTAVDCMVLPHATSHPTDHRLVICDLRLHFRPSPHRKAAHPPRIDTSQLSACDAHAQARLAAAVTDSIAAWQRQHVVNADAGPPPSDPSSLSADLVDIIIREAATVLGTASQPKATHFLSTATLELCKQRREAYTSWRRLKDLQLQGGSAGACHPDMEAALEADREAHRLIDARAAEALQDQINLADDMVKSLRKAVHTACNKDYNQWWDDHATRMNAMMKRQVTGPAWKLLHQLTGVRAADHPTAPVEALRDGAGKVVYGKEAVQAFADHLAQVYEGGHQVPEDLIANIPSMPAASVAAPWQHAPPPLTSRPPQSVLPGQLRQLQH